MDIGKFIEKVSENPLKSALIVLVLIFPVAAPLLVQKYFGYSAINISFGITVLYFVVWKLYELS